MPTLPTVSAVLEDCVQHWYRRIQKVLLRALSAPQKLTCSTRSSGNEPPNRQGWVLGTVADQLRELRSHLDFADLPSNHSEDTLACHCSFADSTAYFGQLKLARLTVVMSIVQKMDGLLSEILDADLHGDFFQTPVAAGDVQIGGDEQKLLYECVLFRTPDKKDERPRIVYMIFVQTDRTYGDSDSVQVFKREYLPGDEEMEMYRKIVCTGKACQVPSKGTTSTSKCEPTDTPIVIEDTPSSEEVVTIDLTNLKFLRRNSLIVIDDDGPDVLVDAPPVVIEIEDSASEEGDDPKTKCDTFEKSGRGPYKSSLTALHPRRQAERTRRLGRRRNGGFVVKHRARRDRRNRRRNFGKLGLAQQENIDPRMVRFNGRRAKVATLNVDFSDGDVKVRHYEVCGMKAGTGNVFGRFFKVLSRFGQLRTGAKVSGYDEQDKVLWSKTFRVDDCFTYIIVEDPTLLCCSANKYGGLDDERGYIAQKKCTTFNCSIAAENGEVDENANSLAPDGMANYNVAEKITDNCKEPQVDAANRSTFNVANRGRIRIRQELFNMANSQEHNKASEAPSQQVTVSEDKDLSAAYKTVGAESAANNSSTKMERNASTDKKNPVDNKGLTKNVDESCRRRIRIKQELFTTVNCTNPYDWNKISEAPSQLVTQFEGKDLNAAYENIGEQSASNLEFCASVKMEERTIMSDNKEKLDKNVVPKDSIDYKSITCDDNQNFDKGSYMDTVTKTPSIKVKLNSCNTNVSLGFNSNADNQGPIDQKKHRESTTACNGSKNIGAECTSNVENHAGLARLEKNKELTKSVSDNEVNNGLIKMEKHTSTCHENKTLEKHVANKDLTTNIDYKVITSDNKEILDKHVILKGSMDYKTITCNDNKNFDKDSRSTVDVDTVTKIPSLKIKFTSCNKNVSVGSNSNAVTEGQINQEKHGEATAACNSSKITEAKCDSSVVMHPVNKASNKTIPSYNNKNIVKHVINKSMNESTLTCCDNKTSVKESSSNAESKTSDSCNKTTSVKINSNAVTTIKDPTTACNHNKDIGTESVSNLTGHEVNESSTKNKNFDESTTTHYANEKLGKHFLYKGSTTSMDYKVITCNDNKNFDKDSRSNVDVDTVNKIPSLKIKHTPCNKNVSVECKLNAVTKDQINQEKHGEATTACNGNKIIETNCASNVEIHPVNKASTKTIPSYNNKNIAKRVINKESIKSTTKSILTCCDNKTSVKESSSNAESKTSGTCNKTTSVKTNSNATIREPTTTCNDNQDIGSENISNLAGHEVDESSTRNKNFGESTTTRYASEKLGKHVLSKGSTISTKSKESTITCHNNKYLDEESVTKTPSSMRDKNNSAQGYSKTVTYDLNNQKERKESTTTFIDNRNVDAKNGSNLTGHDVNESSTKTKNFKESTTTCYGNLDKGNVKAESSSNLTGYDVNENSTKNKNCKESTARNKILDKGNVGTESAYAVIKSSTKNYTCRGSTTECCDNKKLDKDNIGAESGLKLERRALIKSSTSDCKETSTTCYDDKFKVEAEGHAVTKIWTNNDKRQDLTTSSCDDKNLAKDVNTKGVAKKTTRKEVESNSKLKEHSVEQSTTKKEMSCGNSTIPCCGNVNIGVTKDLIVDKKLRELSSIGYSNRYNLNEASRVDLTSQNIAVEHHSNHEVHTVTSDTTKKHRKSTSISRDYKNIGAVDCSKLEEHIVTKDSKKPKESTKIRTNVVESKSNVGIFKGLRKLSEFYNDKNIESKCGSNLEVSKGSGKLNECPNNKNTEAKSGPNLNSTKAKCQNINIGAESGSNFKVTINSTKAESSSNLEEHGVTTNLTKNEKRKESTIAFYDNKNLAKESNTNVDTVSKKNKHTNCGKNISVESNLTLVVGQASAKKKGCKECQYNVDSNGVSKDLGKDEKCAELSTIAYENNCDSNKEFHAAIEDLTDNEVTKNVGSCPSTYTMEEELRGNDEMFPASSGQENVEFINVSNDSENVFDLDVYLEKLTEQDLLEETERIKGEMQARFLESSMNDDLFGMFSMQSFNVDTVDESHGATNSLLRDQDKITRIESLELGERNGKSLGNSQANVGSIFSKEIESLGREAPGKYLEGVSVMCSNKNERDPQENSSTSDENCNVKEGEVKNALMVNDEHSYKIIPNSNEDSKILEEQIKEIIAQGVKPQCSSSGETLELSVRKVNKSILNGPKFSESISTSIEERSLLFESDGEDKVINGSKENIASSGSTSLSCISEQIGSRVNSNLVPSSESCDCEDKVISGSEENIASSGSTSLSCSAEQKDSRASSNLVLSSESCDEKISRDQCSKLEGNKDNYSPVTEESSCKPTKNVDLKAFTGKSCVEEIALKHEGFSSQLIVNSSCKPVQNAIPEKMNPSSNESCFEPVTNTKDLSSLNNPSQVTEDRASKQQDNLSENLFEEKLVVLIAFSSKSCDEEMGLKYEGISSPLISCKLVQNAAAKIMNCSSNESCFDPVTDTKDLSSSNIPSKVTDDNASKQQDNPSKDIYKEKLESLRSTGQKAASKTGKSSKNCKENEASIVSSPDQKTTSQTLKSSKKIACEEHGGKTSSSSIVQGWRIGEKREVIESLKLLKVRRDSDSGSEASAGNCDEYWEIVKDVSSKCGVELSSTGGSELTKVFEAAPSNNCKRNQATGTAETAHSNTSNTFTASNKQVIVEPPNVPSSNAELTEQQEIERHVAFVHDYTKPKPDQLRCGSNSTSDKETNTSSIEGNVASSKANANRAVPKTESLMLRIPLTSFQSFENERSEYYVENDTPNPLRLKINKRRPSGGRRLSVEDGPLLKNELFQRSQGLQNDPSRDTKIEETAKCGQGSCRAAPKIKILNTKNGFQTVLDDPLVDPKGTVTTGDRLKGIKALTKEQLKLPSRKRKRNVGKPNNYIKDMARRSRYGVLPTKRKGTKYENDDSSFKPSSKVKILEGNALSMETRSKFRARRKPEGQGTMEMNLRRNVRHLSKAIVEFELEGSPPKRRNRKRKKPKESICAALTQTSQESQTEQESIADNTTTNVLPSVLDCAIDLSKAPNNCAEIYVHNDKKNCNVVSETGLPFKKRRLSIETTQQQLKQTPDEISYPAKQMISIAEIEALCIGRQIASVLPFYPNFPIVYTDPRRMY